MLFGLGTSWDGFESFVMPAIPHHLCSAKELPSGGGLCVSILDWSARMTFATTSIRHFSTLKYEDGKPAGADIHRFDAITANDPGLSSDRS